MPGPVLDPMFDSADYALRWPPELIARELSVLRTLATGTPESSAHHSRIEFVLEQAFATDVAAAQYRVRYEHRGMHFAEDLRGRRPAVTGYPEQNFLEQLVTHLPSLRQEAARQPYWPERRGHDRGRLDQLGLRGRFVQLVGELRRAGHFGRELPEDCVDDRDPPDADALLAEYLGVTGLWPLAPERWDQDTFLGLVEVFHDLSVRPREREWHRHDGCGWHYSTFSVETGQALYRWRVNRLFDAAGSELRLAETGEDVGRLVHITDPGRGDLLDRARAGPARPTSAAASVGQRVDHAIALFRGRGATEHDKRSAVLALAGVLEQRRDLIRDELGRRDEGALFRLANEFAVRHQRRDQQGDYDPAFLDWMFWWYLATVEVTNTIIDRQETARQDPEPDDEPDTAGSGTAGLRS